MSYSISDNHTITTEYSPQVGGYQLSPFQVFLVRETDADVRQSFMPDFNKACILLGEQIQELQNMERELSKEEQQKLIHSVEALLKLHSLLRTE